MSSDIIRLLPDAVANQIAAGEVVQRPASAVKELLENAIDAGAENIKLIVKDAGRTLIQVIDDGKGMSSTDARMSFERHATSKIKNADDLFNLHTMGFRGEALASIAAVAQVEMRTKRRDDAVATCIIIEGSKVISQEPCAASDGTSISVKNLFFNVPARRNFLKSDAVEFRHILEEFERVALSHPYIGFSLYHNNAEIYRLEPGNAESFQGALRQRIVALFGNPYNQRLVPLQEITDIVRVSGFTCKPEFAKKTRGEQYFFLNNRFIKSSYLMHAVQASYEQLLPSDSFPSFFIFLEAPPSSIDVNIHPTKTEVKFEDERAVYAILRSGVKRALGQYNIAPTLDFEQEMSIEIPYKTPENPVSAPGIYVNPNYNPFHPSPETAPDVNRKSSFGSSSSFGKIPDNWQEMYATHMNTGGMHLPSDTVAPGLEEDFAEQQEIEHEQEKQHSGNIWQLHEKYILTPIKSGVLVIDQQRAHERVLFERFRQALESQHSASQQKLFPDTLEFSPAAAAVILSILEPLNEIGFDVRHFGSNTFVVHGVPAGTEHLESSSLLEGILQQYMENDQDLKSAPKENIARALARQASIKSGRKMETEEMRALIDELFGCEQPAYAPDGKPVFINFPIEELDKRFKR
ncbi:MAG: DNA mismatch repair endonuclease MutL [Bacteroidia bacterium]